MTGSGSAATTCITTGGLFVGDGITSAFESGAAICGPLGIYWGATPPPPSNSQYVAAAGSYPLAPGEIQKLYQIVEPEQQLPFGVPMGRETGNLHRYKFKTVKINIGGRTFDKTYTANQKPQFAFRVSNLTNIRDTIKTYVNFTHDK